MSNKDLKQGADSSQLGAGSSQACTNSLQRCAIMQPTYLPWAGYFHLIASVDVFVFLDDVQFDRRSWQSRNRIFDGGQVNYLTCPVKKASRDTLIRDIALSDDGTWQAQHIKKISLNYAKAPFFQDLKCLIELLTESQYGSLSALNRSIITLISEQLGLRTIFEVASTLNCGGKRSEHLLNICRKVNASSYLSPQGSREYLAADNTFANSGVELAFQEYSPQPYVQVHSPSFESHLSIVDVLANIGINKTRTYILGDAQN
ncbi:WbqC family protein [Ningiella sp. W23]|uniref:WbqC family protein n=1 Tax=Ningiella sp. W23 TaxID=3023715 RepID=UPI0037572AFE